MTSGVSECLRSMFETNADLGFSIHSSSHDTTLIISHLSDNSWLLSSLLSSLALLKTTMSTALLLPPPHSLRYHRSTHSARLPFANSSCRTVPPLSPTYCPPSPPLSPRVPVHIITAPTSPLPFPCITERPSSPPPAPPTRKRKTYRSASSDELDESDHESAVAAPTTRAHADKRRRIASGAAPHSSGPTTRAGGAGSPHSRPSSQMQYRSHAPGSGEMAHAHPRDPRDPRDARDPRDPRDPRGHYVPPSGPAPEYTHYPPHPSYGYGPAPGHRGERDREGRNRQPSPAVEVHALSHPQPPRRGSHLSIKPIGFGASRESRKSGGTPGEHPVPSPVVMGFDFKGIDGDQMKTVRI